jgi:hypothetical protein
MEEPVKEIKGDYFKYEELLKGAKKTSTATIVLDQIKGNHKHTRAKTVEVTHNSISEDIELIVESKIANKRDFKFKLRAPEFTGKPFFRFDSDGVSHYNRAEDIELSKQKVDTPHFHKYDPNGINLAYKTPSLENETECKALLNDINLCMAHYSDESQTFYNDKDYIEIIQTPPTELDFESVKDNPTEGVNYE